MTQFNRAQRNGRKVASTQRARVRTLAAHRADLEEQIRSCIASDAKMALTEPEQVKARMKELRARAGNPSQYLVAAALDVPPRTFQSWENAEVETDRKNYEKVARYYTKRLKEKVSANWILFGQDDAPPLTTPDLTAALNGDGGDDLQQRLDQLEEMLNGIADAISGLSTQLEATSELSATRFESLHAELGKLRRRAA